MYRVTLIPGDGIGPEVILATKKCIEATKVKIEWEEVNAGSSALERIGSPLPKETLESIKRNKVALKGPIITPIAEGFRSVNVELRQSLDLFCCLRPIRSFDGLDSIHKNIDIVVLRENTEDLYCGIEFEEGTKELDQIKSKIEELSKRKIRSDSGISIKPISRSASQRFIEFCFQYAKKCNRKKITLGHKANIMKFTDGLFLNVGREISKKYPEIIFEELVIDNLAMQLIKNPKNFDCIVLPNLYGDIISDLCAGLVGGLGVAAGANIGSDFAIFEPVHGAAPKYKGKNLVNPTAAILSGVLMLEFLGEKEKAQKLESAVREVIREGRFVTYDLKKDRFDPTAVGTKEMAEAIIKRLNEC